MRRAALIVLLAAATACGREKGSGTKFELRPVCKPQVQKLEAEVGQLKKVDAPADVSEQVRGLLLGRVNLHGRDRVLALDDIKAIGDAAVPVLATILAEKDRNDEEIGLALDALGTIDTLASSDALASRINPEKVRPPWVRARAAFALANHRADHVVPWLLSQLKYETDGETVIWIAAVLAKHQNYAGIDGLRVLAADASRPQVQVDAQAALDKIVADAKSTSVEDLWKAWSSPDAKGIPRQEPSPRLRLETWRRIAGLAEFDLRIVDDARFVLAHSAAWVVEPLASALHDDVPHVRVHVAQCLERMGPRAQPACAELVRALDEPHVAGGAAAALGAIGCSDAVDALVKRTAKGNDAEMRNAATAALGRMSSTATTPILRALLQGPEPLDLRQTAAEALAAQGDDMDAVRLLIDCLTLPGGDWGAAEAALDRHLERRAAVSEGPLRKVFEEWRSFGPAPGEIANATQATERRNKRVALIEAAWKAGTLQPAKG